MKRLIFMLFPFMSSISGEYSDELKGLTDEERYDVEYMDSCLFSDNKKISDAALSIMLQILKIANDIDSYTTEMVQEEFNKIKKDLTEEEKEIIDHYTYACINSIGVKNRHKEENDLKLKKERNDK